MRNTIDYFLSLNDLHWRGSAFQWFFYAAVLLTLFFEKRRMVRIVFGWMPLLYLLLIFNPVCIRLLNLAGLFNRAYFARLFSFMPLMYVIARGFMLLVGIANRWIKFAAVVAVCVLICLTGHNIYLEPWFTRAENWEKVPQDTLEIIDAIDASADANTSIAVIDASAVYLRQVSDFVMPYGRYHDQLGELLSTDPPDVHVVMEIAGRQDVEYVVARRTEATLQAFADQGYNPCALTSNYSIFSVAGVPRIQRTFNDKRQIVSITNQNAAGAAEDTPAGYATIVYDYDKNGNRIRESYFDHEGNPLILPGGYHTVQTSWYANGRRESTKYLDLNHRPVLVGGRYETRYRYNIEGRIKEETYYDDQGKPMARTDGLYAAVKYRYMPFGDVSTEAYYDVDGKPVVSLGGYASIKWSYDDLNQRDGVCYYDDRGNVIDAVDPGNPVNPTCLRYYMWTEGARKGDYQTVHFETNKTGNAFNAVLFQLYDGKTGEHLLNFGEAYACGKVKGKYVHQHPSGLYQLVFKGNTNLADESVSSMEYLTEGETLYFSYMVDQMLEKQIDISGFYIGRDKLQAGGASQADMPNE